MSALSVAACPPAGHQHDGGPLDVRSCLTRRRRRAARSASAGKPCRGPAFAALASAGVAAAPDAAPVPLELSLDWRGAARRRACASTAPPSRVRRCRYRRRPGPGRHARHPRRQAGRGTGTHARPVAAGHADRRAWST